MPTITWPDHDHADLTRRSIFHITHLNNLASIVASGFLLAESELAHRSLNFANIGYSHIKARRRTRVVPCAAGGVVADYVPFNFCPRSVMLIAVQRGHAGYVGGPDDVVHLRSTVEQGMTSGRPWAFTDRHAEVQHALYFDEEGSLASVPWRVMPQVYWKEVKEVRQAEFLVHREFPWPRILEVACGTLETAERVASLVGTRAAVTIRPGWYY